jgi:UDP-2-acetamido-2,6-beta-L-arabino-hexul-4-ose reductase
MPRETAYIAVTGAAGFIGRNLTVRLKELGHSVSALTRETPKEEAETALTAADVVVHLAGAVRPQNADDFAQTEIYSAWLAEVVSRGGRTPLIICASSVRADDDTDYGRSKRAVERTLTSLEAEGRAISAIYRLPCVFGKWARPDYNSVVATFCHNLGRGLPIRIDKAKAPLSLLYVDDLVEQWVRLIDVRPEKGGQFRGERIYFTTVGELATMIRAFADGRNLGQIRDVGIGLERALYATYVSALPTGAFSYTLEAHTDARGSFTEMLKTRTSGQFSYFTAHPGVTRGGHYHHSKVEKFLIVHGEALFRFRHILSGDTHEVRTTGEQPMVVETVPGWTHDVTNVGDGMMVSLLWANEVFDRDRPDTVAMRV